MAAVQANVTTGIQANTKTSSEPVRPLANFPPSVWGHRFLSFSLDKSELERYAIAMEKPKEEVRKLIVDPTMDSNEKLGLIYSVHRLGLTYMFLQEIESQLDKLFNEFSLQDYEEVDLYTISINFQVFRHLGYKLPCDVFNKFKDASSGTFKESITSDVRGMLGLYESAQLRIRGEKILDEASVFIEGKLKSVVNTLEGNLAQQVKQSLRRPFHQGMPMVEARLYFSNYEEECSSHDSLFKLAKLHFKYLELQQKEELRIVTKWYKDMRFQETTPFIRDRVPEIYLWILGLYFEPRYSLARIIATKITLFLVVLDDTYDAYATIEEIRLLTDAINKWDISAMEQIPEYIRPFYKVLLDEYAEIKKKMAKEGRANTVIASKEAFERERGKSATGVDAYIKTYGVSEKKAIDELKIMIENAWKDINEGCLKPRQVSMDLLAPILNLARMIDVVYRYDDGFTFPGSTLKEYLFVGSLPAV
ncbi:germacrene A synthase [Tanacetum coccineum]